MSGKIKKSKKNEQNVLDKQRNRDKNYFLVDIADELIKQFNIVTFNGVMYVRNEENLYISDKNEIMSFISKNIPFTKRQLDELMCQFQLRAPKVDNIVGYRLRNGILKKNDKGIFEVVEDTFEFTPFNIDVTYDETANDKVVNKFLDDITWDKDKNVQEEKKNALIELIGSIFLINSSPCKMYYLYGPTGSNGKSTFTTMLRNFIGESLTSNIDIGSLYDDTCMYSLINKLLNISDDADFSILKFDKTSRMKSISSGETLTIRPIYSYPITSRFFCTLVVSCNNLPIFDDKSGGLIRRLVILEFSKKLEKEEKIANMAELLNSPTAKSTLLNLAIKGMNQIINNNYELTESKNINKTMEEYYLETDNIRSFLKDREIEGKAVSEVYDTYKDYCKKQIAQVEAPKNVFGARLKMYGYISKVKEVTEKGHKVSKRFYYKDNSKPYVSL